MLNLRNKSLQLSTLISNGCGCGNDFITFWMKVTNYRMDDVTLVLYMCGYFYRLRVDIAMILEFILKLSLEINGL